MTQASSPPSLMDTRQPLTIATLVDMGLTTDASLRALNDAALQGATLDWEEACLEIGPLTSLPRPSLEALLELSREFALSRQEKGFADAKASGVTVGRPFKELPQNFAQQAQRYLAGETSYLQAARACGMPYSSFRKRVREAQAEIEKEKAQTFLPPRVADACRRWASRELTKKAAAAEAGISLTLFNRTLVAHGFTRCPRELRFADACAKWEAGKSSKKTAIRESGLSRAEFNALLRTAGKPMHFDGEKPHWRDVLESGSSEAIFQRWAAGSLTTAEAAAACGLPQLEFKRAMQHRAHSLRNERKFQGIHERQRHAISRETRA